MDTAGARRLNYSSPSGLNSRARRTDFYLGLIGRFIERFEQIEMTLTERFEQIEERLEEDDDETNARRNRFFSIYREPGKPIDFSNSGTAGLWSDPIECPPAHYVCRLRQRVSNPGGYESRVTAIGFSCCSLAAPAEE